MPLMEARKNTRKNVPLEMVFVERWSALVEFVKAMEWMWITEMGTHGTIVCPI
jgi:hypothetical protein